MSDADIEFSGADVRFKDFDALREAHNAERKAHEDWCNNQRKSDSVPDQEANGHKAGIKAFIERASATGTVIGNERDRRAARAMLEYWAAELVMVGTTRAEALVAPRLADYGGGPQNPGEAPNQILLPDQLSRDRIRFIAAARLWDESGRGAGYLLNGKALEQAMRFRKSDPILKDFIGESERVEKNVKDLRRQLIIGSVIASVLVTAFFMFASLYIFWFTPREAHRTITFLKTDATPTSEEQTAALEFLDWAQQWSSTDPYDLSAIPVALKEIRIFDLKMRAPNFSADNFEGVSFPRAELIGASFARSRFSFTTGLQPNDMREARLNLAQFRGAKIANTSFEGAQLYNAVFDRSALCKVNFSGAALQRASFWGAEIDTATLETLKQTAWWLAEGWSWAEIQRFTNSTEKNTDTENAKLRSSLKNSYGYRDDINFSVDLYNVSSLGSTGQVRALADMAWKRAVWGIDLLAVDGEVQNSNKIAPTAIDAVDQALATIEQLQANQIGSDAYTDIWATILDTKAYILLQSGRPNDAIALFEQLKKSNSSYKNLPPDSLFRYAIAQSASGVIGEAMWMANLDAAITNGGYQPTHELHGLKKLVFDNQKIVQKIGVQTEARWPQVLAPDQRCPT